jgi:hypothetical protein
MGAIDGISDKRHKAAIHLGCGEDGGGCNLSETGLNLGRG